MAYGLNFYSEWSDNEEFIYRTEILRRDYSGAATEVTSGGAPFVVSLMDDATTDVFHAVRTQKAEIEWVSDVISGFDISDIFITDDQEYQIKFGTIDPDTEDFDVRWSGYLTFTDCKEPFLPKPYAVQLAGLCGLALMRDQRFLDAEGKFVEGIESLMDIIVMCLAQANLELEIDVHVGLKSQLSNPIPISQTYIDTDGLRGKSAYEVLDGILNSVNAFITQQDGRWLIRGIREQQADTIPVYRFAASGNFIEQTTVTQVVSIGSEELAEANPDYTNILPMSDVMESLAEPYSLVTNVVSPGIPVNLLNNGTFNPDGDPWGINLGAMTGWAHSPEPKGWRYEGTGTPDDPYRFIMIGSVKTTGDIVYDQKDANVQAFTTIYNTEPITIYRDGGKDSYPNIKIKVSGAFRMRDGGRLMIAARLNDGDKDYVQWLDENGTWTAEKKFVKRTNIKVTGDTPHNPEEYLQLANIPLQTFEVTSSKIPDYLNRPGGWIAKLYFNIYPTAVGADTFPEISNNFSPAVWLEDFCVSITTETKFEGEHEYQIDGKKLIRNGDEYEYTTIVADKISIKTAHQKRDTFRVMTGYASVGIADLTNAWQRSINGSLVGDPEPLQHLTLRERLRLLCGKRRVLEGTFYGEGVGPANCVTNLFDGGGGNYYTITGWSWDVKNRMYQIRIHELDFTPLEEEVITLTDSRDNGRGDRLYTNSGGSTNSGNGSGTGDDGHEEIVLDEPIDPIEYEVLVEDEEPRVFDIGALILSNHVPELLEAKILNFPSWISEIELYRGEDLDPDSLPEGGILQLKWIGKPIKSGPYQINIELVGPDAEDYILVIPITVTPSEEFTEEWPPVFDPFPVLYFQLDRDTTTGFLITDYMTSGHVNLTYRFLGLPDWITDRSVIFDLLSMTGHPVRIETRKVTMEIKDAIGRISVEELTLQVIPATEITAELIADGDVIGPLPGAYENPTVPWNTPVTVNGLHDKVEVHITGGGDNADEIDITKIFTLTDPVESGTYSPIDTPTVTTPGQFAMTVTVSYGTNETEQVFDFTLFDEEYLAKMKKFLVKGFDYVGEIMPNGATSFVYPGPVNARAEIHDVDYDEIYLSLEKDSVVVGSQHITDVNPTLAWWFEVFEEDTELEPGVYTFPVRLLKDGVEVFKRTDTFVIETKDAEAMPVISLGTFNAGTTNVSILEENIPLKGAEYDLPANYTFVFNGFGSGITYSSVEPEFYFMRGGSFAEVDIEQFTGTSPVVTYPTPVSSGKVYAFGSKSSLKIGDIHQAPSRVLVKFIARDADGKVVGIAQADVSFRVALDPGDYSGLRFLTYIPGDPMNLLDANMPKTGRKYALPPAGTWWTVSVRSFDGAEFDEVIVKLSRIDGTEIILHLFGEDYIVLHHVGSVVTELDDDDKAYVFGVLVGDDRVVYDPDFEPVLLDQLGVWKVTMIALLESVEVATKETTFELIEEVEPPIKDCCAACDCEGGGGEWNGGAEPEW